MLIGEWAGRLLDVVDSLSLTNSSRPVAERPDYVFVSLRDAIQAAVRGEV
jgi:hypothetical protein